MSRRNGHIPVRTCVCCGAKRNKMDLIRLVLDAEGRVVRDHSGSRPGRGAYVCPLKTCWERLEKGGRLSRAFRSNGPLRFCVDLNIHDITDNTTH